MATAKVSLKTIFSIPLLVNEDDDVGLPKPVPLDWIKIKQISPKADIIWVNCNMLFTDNKLIINESLLNKPIDDRCHSCN